MEKVVVMLMHDKRTAGPLLHSKEVSNLSSRPDILDRFFAELPYDFAGIVRALVVKHRDDIRSDRLVQHARKRLAKQVGAIPRHHKDVDVFNCVIFHLFSAD